MNILVNYDKYNIYYYYFRMDKEQWKELWIRKQAKDRGAIEWAIIVKSGKIEGEIDQGAKEWAMDATRGVIEEAMDQ